MMTPSGRSANADNQVEGVHAAIPTHGAADALSTGGLPPGTELPLGPASVNTAPGLTRENNPGELQLLTRKACDAAKTALRGLSRDPVRGRERQAQDDLDDLEAGRIGSTANPTFVRAPMITGRLVISFQQNLDLHGNADVNANTAGGGPPGTTDGAANIPVLDPSSHWSGTTTIDVFCPSGSGGLARIAITRNHPGNVPPYNKLTKIALAFFAQLAAAVLARVLSGSTDNWAAITLLLACLIGFVLILISMSSMTINRASVSPAIAKVGFATVVYAVIISIAVALPIHSKAKIAATALASLPALIAVARAPA